MRPPGGIPEGQRIFELVNSKFRALDDLVYVLKKRILSLETNEELADAVKQFGNVGELLEDNKRLRAENQKLRAREQRFLADPLLRRRQLNTMSREQLQTLIICLQNELSASRNVLDRHTVKQVAQVHNFSMKISERPFHFTVLVLMSCFRFCDGKRLPPVKCPANRWQTLI